MLHKRPDDMSRTSVTGNHPRRAAINKLRSNRVSELRCTKQVGYLGYELFAVCKSFIGIYTNFAYNAGKRPADLIVKVQRRA